MCRRRIVCLVLTALTGLNILMARYVFKERPNDTHSRIPVPFRVTSPKPRASLNVVQVEDIHPVYHLEEAEKLAMESHDGKEDVFKDISVSDTNMVDTNAFSVYSQLNNSPVEIVKQHIQSKNAESENTHEDNFVLTAIATSTPDKFGRSQKRPPFGHQKSALDDTARWNSNSSQDQRQGSNSNLMNIKLDTVGDRDTLQYQQMPDLNKISNQLGFQGSENQNHFAENENIASLSADDNAGIMQGNSILNSVSNLRPPEGAAVLVPLQPQDGVLKISSHSEVPNAFSKFSMDNLPENNRFSPIETIRDRGSLENIDKNNWSPTNEIKRHIGIELASPNNSSWKPAQTLMKPAPAQRYPVEFKSIAQMADSVNPTGTFNSFGMRTQNDAIPNHANSQDDLQRLKEENMAKPLSSRLISNAIKYNPAAGSLHKIMTNRAANPPNGLAKINGVYYFVDDTGGHVKKSLDVSQKMLDNIARDNGIDVKDQERQMLSNLLKRLLESTIGQNDLHNGSNKNFHVSETRN